MPDTIPNLWPPEFKIDVQTPYTILQVQAGLLGKVTRGILKGDVETETSKEQVQHRLVIIAPAYKGYRHTLIVTVHNNDLPYPAEVRADPLAKRVMDVDEGVVPDPFHPVYKTIYPIANSDEQMQDLLKQVLGSEQTKAIILSLIAKSNETSRSPSPVPQDPTEGPCKID